MIFPKLFKYTAKGQTQSWQIFTSGNLYWTEEGIHILTKSEPTVCTGKNIGRSNETTDIQQAILEATSKHQKKLDNGYNEVLTTDKKFFEPMLAFELKQYEKLLFTVPTWVQPKLDGIRCILDNKNITTRAGKPIVSCRHIQIYCEDVLDGELYNHDLKSDFNKIISLVRKTKPTLEDIKESEEKIQYWIYDLPGESVFSQRYKTLQKMFGDKRFPDYFKLVPTIQIFDKTQLDYYHTQFLEQGYEGTMIRMDLGGYENKRSKQLLKYKNFQDAEFLILDVTPGLGNRSECAGRLVCQIGDKTFGCSMTGTVEFMKEVLDNKDQVIGKYATVKFFEMTSSEDGISGVPRFPTLKHINDYNVKTNMD